jgi:hypothetical protein
MLSYAGVLLVSALQSSSPVTPEPRFLETVRVVSVRVSDGEATLTTADGGRRVLHEGDTLEEEDARLQNVTTATLTFTRRVVGGNGEEGESLIVVRFDASGKTKVREYRTVGDAVAPGPPSAKPKPKDFPENLSR